MSTNRRSDLDTLSKPPLPLPLPRKKQSLWKSFKSLSHIHQRRYHCQFTLYVHSITNLHAPLTSSPLTVHWHPPSSAPAHTHPVRAVNGIANFNDNFSHRCTVYASRSNKTARYDPREFRIWVSLGTAGPDLGTNVLDLTRLLPVTDVEDADKRSGEWSTSFRLSGKAKGALLSVSFGFSIIDDHGGGSKVLHKSRSMEDVKVLHEVLHKSRSVAELSVGNESPDNETGSVSAVLDTDEQVEEVSCSDNGITETCMSPTDSDSVTSGLTFVELEGGQSFEDREFSCDCKSESMLSRCRSLNGATESSTEQYEEMMEFSCDDNGIRESSPGDSAVEDLDSDLSDLLFLELEGAESPLKEANEQGFSESKTPKTVKTRPLSLDGATADSVASEFLSMLGIEHSPFGLSSDSDSESPRERLLKQFEKDSLLNGDVIFGFNIGEGEEFYEDFDLSSIIHEAEKELERETQGVDSKSRAKMLEDEETETLMREWGLNLKAFQNSPSGSPGGFGSPIDLPLPPEESLGLPPLGEGLGPFLQTKDGGFVRSMNPSLFKNAKNKGSLIMQVSRPVVVPAEMGSGIMDILQGLASVGIEKLSSQAKKLMPLEDISGKTMQQVVWAGSPTLEPYERQELLQHPNPDRFSGIGQNGKKKKGKGFNLASSGGEEYVSLEDLAPLAMDQIEALSLEGLRIQSGMSDQEAPSNTITNLEVKESKNSGCIGLEGAAGLQLLNVKDNGDDVEGLMGLSLTLDEWMRLDSGIIDEEHIGDRTSKILAAHHACSTEFVNRVAKEGRGGKKSAKRWGLLGSNFTVALMVQLRDPLRNFEPVGTPMLSLIQVERVSAPPKPKIYSTVSEIGNSEEDDKPETEVEVVLVAKIEEKEEKDVVPQFKIAEVHVAGLKSEPGKKKMWGNQMQQQSGSRWLLATGMGKSNKHPFMKSKAATTMQSGDTLWSVSSCVHGTGAKCNVRNPDVVIQKQPFQLR